LFYTEVSIKTALDINQHTILQVAERGMRAKLSSIAQFNAQLDDVVIIDEHTIVG
jgi:hypothetical protein